MVSSLYTYRENALEIEVGADHRLGVLSEFASRAEGRGQLGCLVDIAAVLEAQAKMGQDRPVDAGAVVIEGFGLALRLCAASAAAGRVEVFKSAACQSEDAEIGEGGGDHPVQGKLTGGCLNRLIGDVTERHGAGGTVWGRSAVSLIGPMVGVGDIKANQRVGDVPEFEHESRLMVGVLLGVATRGRSWEGAQSTDSNAGLRLRGQSGCHEQSACHKR